MSVCLISYNLCQADNCADNKNWATLVLLALLVRTGTFTRVEFNFLYVGHTHEVIDQIFAVISDYLRSTDDEHEKFGSGPGFEKKKKKPWKK